MYVSDNIMGIGDSIMRVRDSIMRVRDSIMSPALFIGLHDSLINCFDFRELYCGADYTSYNVVYSHEVSKPAPPAGM
jgi:hypothetical protein